MINVEKRNGEVVGFDLGRIRNAIKAFDATSNKYTTEILDLIALRATADFQTKLAGEVVSVETIQIALRKHWNRQDMDLLQKPIFYIENREKN